MVVDDECNITHIETGYPGGNNDKGIFNQSTIITEICGSLSISGAK
jgi:hypothetical protein